MSQEFRTISDADWVRLANIDDAGDSTKFPYSPKFVNAGDFKSMAYDRFWDAGEQETVNTSLCSLRWLCSGYGLVVVSDKENEFANDEQSGLPVHFRQHYFKLYLVAQMHRATLLNFKQRIANALDRIRSNKDGDGNSQFTEEILKIDRDFLYFRSTYWYTEMTNQIQGRQMFNWISEHLQTRSLFEQIRSEIRDAVSYIQSREMVHSVSTIKEMQTNIEWVELFIVGVYAIELPYAFSHLWNLNSFWYRLLATAMAAVSLVVIARLTKPWEHPGQELKRKYLLAIGIAWALILAVSVVLFGFNNGQGSH